MNNVTLLHELLRCARLIHESEADRKLKSEFATYTARLMELAAQRLTIDVAMLMRAMKASFEKSEEIQPDHLRVGTSWEEVIADPEAKDLLEEGNLLMLAALEAALNPPKPEPAAEPEEKGPPQLVVVSSDCNECGVGNGPVQSQD